MSPRIRPRARWLGALALVPFLLGAASLPGQEPQAPADPPPAVASDEQESPPPVRLEVEDIAARIKALEARDDLEEDVRSTVSELLRQAQDLVRRASEQRVEAAELDEQAEESADKTEALHQELAQPPEEPVAVVPPGADRKQIESLRDEADAADASAKKKVADLEADQALRENRLKEIPAEIEALEQNIQEARTASGAATPEGQDGLVAETQRLLAVARVEYGEAALAKLNSERSSFQARRGLLQLRLDQAKRAAGVAKILAEDWQEKADGARRLEAEREARATRARAQQQATRRWATLGQASADAEELTEERSGEDGLLQRIELARAERKRLGGELERVSLGYLEARRRLRVAGDTFAMGLLLRHEYEQLPDSPALSREERLRRRTISSAEYRRILLQERRGQVGDVGIRIKHFLEEVDQDPEAADMSASDRASLEELATQLFTSERDLLTELDGEYAAYSTLLVEMQADSEQLRTVAAEFADFVAERVLWIRSVARGKTLDYSATWAAFLWFIGQDPDAEAESLLTAFGRDHTVALSLLPVLGLAFFLLARWCRGRLDKLAPEVSRYRTDSYWYTVEAVFLTLAIALPIPAVLELLAVTGHEEMAASTWLSAWLGAIQALVPSLFAFLVLRAVAIPRGLGEAHFRWRSEAVASIRKDFGWFIPLAVLLGAPDFVLERQSTGAWLDSLGRISFMLRSACAAVFAWRLFRPGGPLLAGYYERNPQGVLHRLRYVILVLAITFPVADSVAALLGFSYTAHRLREALAWTGVYVMGLVLVHNLGLRWLYIARRRMAVSRALQMKEERERQAEQEQAQEATQSEPTVDVDQVDIPAMDAQTRALFQAAVVTALVLGLFSIWSSMIPSLRYLDRMQVLPHFALLEQSEGADLTDGNSATAEATQSTGAPAQESAAPSPMTPMAAAESVTQADDPAIAAVAFSVTVADLGLSLLFLVLTVLGARNIPGLLEIAVLRRLPLDAGARYAAITITRYLIVIVGVTATLNAVHVTWDTVKWLAAALTFGLAFGLQEIFANFISGLIVLLERPIRVGDTVTVGTTTGAVSRIRMRATTIVDWNNRELLVPNKNFITNEIVNWTLTNTIRRVDFAVGVAYGSDTRKTRELLESAAQESAFVLEDPKPYALFQGFGASSLDFELRVYIPSGAVWIDLMNDVHTRVDDLFRKAGIEIAFPQLDLHLRSAEAALRVGLQPAGAPPAVASGAPS